MDDLHGLDWTIASNSQQPSGPVYPSLRPSPAPSSGRSTPSAFQLPASNSSQPSLRIGSKPATPANDSFASLLSGGKPKVTNSLSLQERQRQLAEERAKKSQQFDTRFGQQTATPSIVQNHSGASGLLTASVLPARGTPSPVTQHRRDNDDILAAFNSSTKVDSSSHFPPAAQDISKTATPLSLSNGGNTAAAASLEDDDPFALSSFASKPKQSSAPKQQDDDGDILGMLGRPVHEVSGPTPASRVSRQALSDDRNSGDGTVPTSESDKAVAELVDMGFTPDKAAIALAQTDSGHDVRAAVGILLNQAHEESRNKIDESSRTKQSGRAAGSSINQTPSWMKQKDDESRSSSQARSQAGSEKDVAKIASDLGNTLFKSANSLWKTSQKKVQKAMADFQQEGGDSSQPKWMRDVQSADVNDKPKAHLAMKREVTDEAAMLESGDSRPLAQQRPWVDASNHNHSNAQRENGPASSRQKFAQQPLPGQNDMRHSARAATRATREELESHAPEAYISPARRRRPQAPTSEMPAVAQHLKKSPLASPPIQSSNPSNKVTQRTQQISRPTVRPSVPARRIPPASSSAISSASQQRQKGTEAFKRGDFATAHAAYSSALQPLPQSHPITIVIFCNRALTSLKNGDPKAAISDAESALDVIGVSRGEGEKIDLGHTEGQKNMKEFFGKALMRKAEALENMEKWTDAGKVWRDAVEAGVGGSISIQGRNRCDKASGGTGHASAPKNSIARPKQAVRKLVVNHAASQEAVKKLRQANEAAERADDEKFALTDQVDAKLVAWKGSKADNLRALLGSLDKVLWPEAGWNKVGMADLVMANRVKIIYMKAIAKVHPDKISQSATTEQRMLSAAIFSTLNEAWDKFKQENNL